MSRISTFGANGLQLFNMLGIQKRLHNTQVQIGSQKVSQDYAGISMDSLRLLLAENKMTRADHYVKSNAHAELRMGMMQQAADSVGTSFSNFRSFLNDFMQGNRSDPNRIGDLQQIAWETLKGAEAYLNTQFGGDYLFAGGKTTTAPVSLGFESLQAFQQAYDGYNVTYPTTRAADIANKISLPAETGPLSFDLNAGTITTGLAGGLNGYPVGSTITVANSDSNDGRYTVLANDGTTIRVARNIAVEGPVNTTFTRPDGTSFSASNVTFAAPNTFTAAVPTEVSGLAVGDVFNISGTAGNNGKWRVANNLPAGTITVERVALTNETTLTTEAAGAAAVTWGGTAVPSAYSFNGATSTISAANAGDTAGVPVGARITVAGSASNNGDFVVVSNDGQNMVVARAGLTISTQTYYRGDNHAVSQEIAENQKLEYGVTAIHPAFEKAMRAVAIIAQGRNGTAGSLANNTERYEAALTLLNSSLNDIQPEDFPYGAEDTNNMKAMQTMLGLRQQKLNAVTVEHKLFSSSMEDVIAGIENIDMAETIIRMQDQQRSLEASYQTLATARQMSLLNFL